MDGPQPRNIVAVDPLERSVRQSVVSVDERVRDVLTFRYCFRGNLVCKILHEVLNLLVQVRSVPREVEVCGEQTARAVGWVCRSGAVGEKIRGKRLDVEGDKWRSVETCELRTVFLNRTLSERSRAHDRRRTLVILRIRASNVGVYCRTEEVMKAPLPRKDLSAQKTTHKARRHTENPRVDCWRESIGRGQQTPASGRLT